MLNCNHKKTHYSKEYKTHWCADCLLPVKKTWNFVLLISAILFTSCLLFTSYVNNKGIPMPYFKIENNDVQLNDTSITECLIEMGFQFPEVALAKIKHETGNYKSENCLKNKNLFGYGWNGKTYYIYPTYRASIEDYKKWEEWFILKHSRIYAEDPLYAEKLKSY